MVKQIEIGKVKIGSYLKPVFIAEIGINHGGDFHVALDMVDAAVESGADIVKFQHHIPEREMVKGHEWQELMQKCKFVYSQLKELKDYTEREGAEFLCTPFCKEAAIELDLIGVKGFKTGSGECNNLPFQEWVAQYHLPTIISTGMTSRDELFRTLDSVRKINRQIVLMNCTSTYPATPREARLKRIWWLNSTFNIPVGQSDHTPTISTALGAIAHGAVCIEKHLTLDKSWDGPDQAASILPHEFKQLVEMGMEIWEGMQMCIEADMGVLAREKDVRKIANHSVVAAQYIHEGFVVDAESVTTMRTGDDGVPASEIENVVGRVAVRDIREGEVLTYGDLV